MHETRPNDALTLVLGDQQAVLDPVGGKLAAYTVAGRDAVVPYAVGTLPPAFSGAVLAPWPNRLRDGAYTWDGEALQAALNDGPRGNALHGLACWQRWDLLAVTAASARLALDLPPQPGWPFSLVVEVAYALGGDGLTIALTAENTGTRALPYGAGFHPWLSTGGASLDACTVQLDASTRIVPDDRLLPTGAGDVAGTPYDLRRPSSLAGLDLDDAWDDAAFDASGRSWGRLTCPDGRAVAVWMEAPLACWQLCTGDHIPGFTRAGLALEPMTCLADAFNTGAHLVTLEPGASHAVRWGIQVV